MIYCDSEYRRSQDPDMEIVAWCSMHDTSKPHLYFVHKNTHLQNTLKEELLKRREEPLVVFNATAEARTMLQIGLDIKKFRFLDVMVMAKLCRNVSHKDYSLLSTCQEYGITHPYTQSKNEMRDLILNNTKYTDKEKEAIAKYCVADTMVLRQLYRRLMDELVAIYEVTEVEMEKRIRYLSAFVAYTAIIEQNGMGIDVLKVKNIINHQKTAVVSFQERCNNVYPFYTWTGSRFTCRYDVKADYIFSNGLDKDWPTTDTGRLCFDKDTMKKFQSVSPELKILYETEKVIRNLASFSPSNSKVIAHTGTDGRLRPYFGPYGTVTGRNAASASYFPFAMSRGFRFLLKAEEGYCITGVDWGQQEIAIAAYLSGDDELLDSYNSGDVYASFAAKAGAYKEGQSDKERKLIRNKFKATTLGIGYGMGKYSLALKLTNDTGTKVTVQEASNLINLHKRVYRKYWKWVDGLTKKIREERILTTKDFWGIQGNSEHMNSLRNWPVQSSGSMLLHFAIIRSLQRGLKVIAPLHDAIYIEHKEGDMHDVETLEACMSEAVSRFFPGLTIRTDRSTHLNSETWIEDGCDELVKLLDDLAKDECNLVTAHFIPPDFETFNLFEEEVEYEQPV